MGKKRKKNNNRNYNQKKAMPIEKTKKLEISNAKEKNENNFKQEKLERQNINNTNNYNTKSINNYDTDKKLSLDENKKNDIQRIFEPNENNSVKPKINIYKLLTVIMFLIIVVLTVILLIINNTKSPECEIADCPVDNDNQDNNVDNQDPKEETYLFLGDSIFYQYNTGDHFRDYNTINTGVNGITALETLDRVEESVYQYNPTTIFILLGTNDLYKGYTATETFDHLKDLIDKIHSDRPEITINVLSILPINKSDNPKVSKEANENKTNEQINEVNNNLRKYCEDNDLTYINVHDLLLDSNGELNLAYTYEGLHITELGYHHITVELLKYIQK